MSGVRSALARFWPYLAHAPVVLLLFSGVLLEGRVPYFRDLLAQYLPDYAFVARAAQQGVSWPLWNPLGHGGAPFLMPYPIDLISVRLLGPLNALRLDAPLHVLIGMCGASLLARARGSASVGAWATGLFYGLSGFLLSSSNPMQILHGACWAPWVIAAVLVVMRSADGRACALLGLAVALQLSTLAAEIVLQTALAAAFLLPRRPTLRQLGAFVAAAALAAALAAPVLVGAGWLLEGTRRALGFEAAETLAWSASPLVLGEAFFPHLFGDVRTFSELAYWGKPFFSAGLPYFSSLYVGPGVLLLAAVAGWRRDERVLWILAGVGLLLSLGANGPLAPVELLFLKHFRYPIKFFFLVNLALCLLAGQGVDACARGRSNVSRWAFALPLSLLAAAGALVLWPELPARLVGGLVPELLGAPGRFVAGHLWPGELLRAGALCLAAVFALRLPARAGALAALLVATDLMAANLVLNPAARADFYALQPEPQAVVEGARVEGPFRWFALSLDATPGVRFAPLAVRANSDVVAYRVARQSLFGRSSALDGLESALEVEDSFAPLGSTLPRELRQAARFREFFPQLRLANVRWIVSLAELPDDDLVKLVSPVALPELLEPLRFYEVRAPLARAFWTSRCEVVADPAELQRRLLSADFDPRAAALLDASTSGFACGGETRQATSSVEFEQPDPHTVRLRAQSPPGFVVVIEGFHRDWQAVGPTGPVPIARGDGRYWVLPTPGGEQAFEVRFRPRWPAAALALSALGLAVAGLALGKGAAPARPPAG